MRAAESSSRGAKVKDRKAEVTVKVKIPQWFRGPAKIYSILDIES